MLLVRSILPAIRATDLVECTLISKVVVTRLRKASSSEMRIIKAARSGARIYKLSQAPCR